MCLLWGSLGFLVGWIVFKRPEWTAKAIAWIKGKLGMG